ncbi:MAG: CbtB domain-containing protein [Candidatus Nitrospinota bacterium M3_3B_026]
MENILGKQKTSSTQATAALALVLCATVFAAVVVSFGLDSVIMGAHDVFHDFRHAIGMPCH